MRLSALVTLPLVAVLGCSATGTLRPVEDRMPQRLAAADARGYDLHVPAARAEEPLPLVVAFHGAFSSPEELDAESGLRELAEREQFVVAFPRGSGFLGLLRVWNSGHCCGPAHANDVDDVEYTRQIIESVKRRTAIDPSRVYVIGMSNGAMMAHRVSSALSDEIAATAAVSGTIGGRPSSSDDVWRIPRPRSAVPMLVVHGDADEIVPWDGGEDPYGFGGRTWLSVEDTLAFWRDSNDAAVELPRAESHAGVIERREWRGERSSQRVVLLRFADWGHAWPGGPYTDALERTHPLAGYEAVEEIWAFLSEHRLG